MRFLPFATTLVLATTMVAQQQELGFDDGWGTTYTDRCGANNIDADALVHFDNRNHLDWMLDPTDPTGATFTFSGCRLVTQDQVGTTPVGFTIVGYEEDTVTPDTPGALWFRTGIFNLPASTTTTAVAWIWTIGFAPPAIAKGGVFLGAELAISVPAWPADGISLHCAFNGPPGDNPGPGRTAIPNGNISCHMPTTLGVPVPPAIFPAGGAAGLRQIRFEPMASVAAGVAVTQTNQTSYPASNAGSVGTPLGGTTNMMSGVYPDVYDGNLSTIPRADNIGFLFKDNTLPNAPVFVIVSFGGSPVGSLPLTTLAPIVGSPGTRGNVCVDFVGGANFLLFSDAVGTAQFMLTLSAPTRLVLQSLAPIDIWYQGFALNTAAPGPLLEVHASGCAVQHL